MDPVLVPAPPRSAYNQNRRISDLLYNQLKHFQHVESKRGDLGIDPEIARNIHTEGGAAMYISAVTIALRGKTIAPSVTSRKVSIMAPPNLKKKSQAGIALAIAAVAEASSASNKTSAKKAVKKKSAAKDTAKPRKGER